MPTDAEYQQKIEDLDWDELLQLWERIKNGTTQEQGWASGKALEYLVLQAFKLSDAEVVWPYSVKLEGEEIEQIDGAVYLRDIAFLVECKDHSSRINIEPIAKLRNQLLRRPGTVIGVVFSREGFTNPASTLARFTSPQTILLWNDKEIKQVLRDRDFCRHLITKYRACIERGLPDFDIRQAAVVKETPAAKEAYLIVEGTFDKYLLEKVLDEEVLEAVEIVVGGGKQPATTIAQSLLATGERPTALLVDADTTAPSEVHEQKEYLQATLAEASLRQDTKVFLAVPEIEVILFESLDLIEKLTGQKPNEYNLPIAKEAPKKSLMEYIGVRRLGLKPILDEHLTVNYIQSIRQNPLIQELQDFLRSVT